MRRQPLTATATASPILPTVTPTRVPAASLTPTESPTPTPAWQPYSGILTSGKQETVSSSSIDTSTPIDILPEFTLTRVLRAKDCSSHKEASVGPQYATSEMLQKAKQMDAPLLLSCGWGLSDSIKLTIRYPDGRENTKTFVANKSSAYTDNINSVSTFYQITLDDPPGVYTFIAESGQERIETQLTVEKAYYTLGPRVFPIYDDPFAAHYHLFQQNRVLLYGFSRTNRSGCCCTMA